MCVCVYIKYARTGFNTYIEFKNKPMLDFPGGLVVKKAPANAGNMDSITGPGRFHMPLGSWACAP